jgi:hypothetical protein
MQPTVAKEYNYPIMQHGMTRYWYLSSCTKAGSPERLLPATVAADLHPYRTEIYHLTKRVIHAYIDA